jgi:glycosyltransferase involved in cell wall biosynthesis
VSVRDPILSAIVAVGSPAESRRIFHSLITSKFTSSIQLILVIDLKKIEEFGLDELKKAFGSNLQVVVGEYGSPGIARNAGLRLATGEWIVFWDCDDAPIEENIFELIVSVSDEYDAVIGSYVVVDQKSMKVIRTTKAFSDIDFFTGVGLWRMIFRRKVIGSTTFSEIEWGEDSLFVVDLGLFDLRFLATPKPLYRYYSGDVNQITHTTTRGRIRSLKKLDSVLAEKFRSSPQRFDIFALSVKTNITLFKRENGLARINRSVKLMGLSLGFLKNYKLMFRYWNMLPRWIIGRRLNYMRIIPIAGGLGNQLFQFAASHAFSSQERIELDVTLSKPRVDKNEIVELFNLIESVDSVRKKSSAISHFVSKVFGYNRRVQLQRNEKFQSKAYATFIAALASGVTSIYFKRRVSSFYCRDLGFEEIPRLHKNTITFGYFQTFRWASKNETNEILQNMSPKYPSEKFLALLSKAKNERPIVVQVRLTDYLQDDSFGILSPKYYDDTISKVSKEIFSNHSIWLFSDDPMSANSKLNTQHKKDLFIVPSDLSASETLELMKYGSAYVIANSSFGWWAAYLKKDKNARVFAPSPWFANLPEPCDLFPPEWILTPSDFKTIELER